MTLFYKIAMVDLHEVKLMMLILNTLQWREQQYECFLKM